MFEFFSKAENLSKITPSSLGFKVLTPLPIVMKAGTLIDYRISILGVPARWRTEITDWDAPNRFADNQLKGPYLLWLHTHIFTPRGVQTAMRDRVQFRIPGWFLEPLIYRLMVRPMLTQIFGYRNQAMGEKFGFAETEPLSIV